MLLRAWVPVAEKGKPEMTLRRPGSSANSGLKVGLDNMYSVGFSASMPLIAPQLWKSLKLSDSQILQNIELARASRLLLVNQFRSLLLVATRAGQLPGDKKESGDSNL